jgi:hypothetical protein
MLSSLQHNVRWGVKIGLRIGSLFAAWVVVLRFLMGSAFFERLGVPWFVLAGAYLTAGGAGGGAYGALRPLQRSAIGSILSGFVLVFPTYVAIAFLLSSDPDPRVHFHNSCRDGAILGAIVGSVLGLFLWVDERKKGKSGMSSEK